MVEVKEKETEKDLGVKIGSPELALWERVKNEAQELIKQRKNELIIQEAILKLASKKVEEEEKKLKK